MVEVGVVVEVVVVVGVVAGVVVVVEVGVEVGVEVEVGVGVVVEVGVGVEVEVGVVVGVVVGVILTNQRGETKMTTEKETKKTDVKGLLSKGAKVFIRTVTHYYTGRVKEVKPLWIVIEDAAWIADTARFADALKSGKLNEVEPYPSGPVYIALGAVVDICEWQHDLPREQK